MTAISIAGTAGCQTGNYWRYTPTGAKGPRSINAKMMPRSIVTCLPLVFYEEATHGRERRHTRRVAGRPTRLIASLVSVSKGGIPEGWAFDIP